MIVLLVILVLLALAFGVGAVLEGIAWAMLIGIVLLAAAGWMAWQKLRGVSRSS
jgi:preprotein translocase subunit SecF